MKNCIFYKMFWNIRSWNIEISINLTRWLVGFGWAGAGKFIHFNFGPAVISFIKSID